jgi:hypothetical protein
MPEPPPISATSSNSFSACQVSTPVSKNGQRVPRTLVRELGDRALDGQRVTRLERLVDVLGRLASVVLLDEEHELARVVRRRDRCIRAHDGLSLVVRERFGVRRLDDNA